MHCAWKVEAFVWREKKGGKLYSRGKVKEELEGVLVGGLASELPEDARVVSDWEKEFDMFS